MKFLRRDTVRYSKLGKGRKKLQKWKRPRGRDNKIRLSRKGYPAAVSIGFKKPLRPQPVVIYNAKELEKLQNQKQIILGKIGAKKKLELVKIAESKGIKIINFGGKK